VYGYNLSGDYGSLIPAYALTTDAIDCTDMEEVELWFWKWLGVESASFDHASVEASNDGVVWTTVWDHIGSSVSDSSWSQMVLDVSEVADGEPTVYLRWLMGPTDGSVTYPGWNLDDVEVWGLSAYVPPPCPWDHNGDGVVNPLDVNRVKDHFGCDTADPECAEYDHNEDDVVNPLDVNRIKDHYGPCP